ncbi:uncharacterized protein LOC127522944 [Ctenopharyngodon idella]|uniref:uncharacterized protein LOC127522944 n=1 Tax=Ctenopharyngodon idella TaxID=7959 RepID=UPI002230CC9C|nr:uncharacterized protein LOC127522944 [Ctenopharyngodon idella]
MALFIFITFQLLLQVKSQGFPQANLTIFPTSATSGEKVQMECGGYKNHRVSECMFYPEGQESFKKPSASCNLTLTSTELILWSHDAESSHVNISCYYTVYSLAVNETSPHSNKVSVRVRGLAAMSSLPPITEDSPTTLTPNGTTEANLSTASTMDTTTPLAVASSTEIITDPITNMTSLTTNDSQSSTGPANASLESTTVTETTEHTSGPEILKYLNKKIFFSISVVATGGGIVLTGLFGICLYGCTRRPKDERIWIERKSRKQGVPLPMAGSDSSGEEDTAFYSTINSVQSTSQPSGNSKKSKQTKMELNPLYYTVLKQPLVSTDNKDVYSVVTVN